MPKRRPIVRALFGWMILDDRGGTPIEGLPAPPSFWYRAWRPDEDFPEWWTYVVSWLRRAWYRSTTEMCNCPGCDHPKPKWWAASMCQCCCEEDCCHEEDAA
jgi:hypothetical protein